MQEVVAFRVIFLDENIDWPGKVHDARILDNSSLYTKANNGDLYPNWTRNMNGVEVPLIILGDPAYPLLPWLMKPYLESVNTTESHRNFNYRQSRARMVVENAFGRLKGRWRSLLKRMDCNIRNFPFIIGSCVTLHNMCEIYGDPWLQNGEQDEITPHPHSVSTATGPPNANAIRDAIKIYLA
jgi:hypothetical protein